MSVAFLIVQVALADIVTELPQVSGLPACKDDPCADIGGEAVMRCPVGAACEAVQGASLHCRTRNAPNPSFDVWCRPLNAGTPPVAVPPVAAPPAAAPALCSTSPWTLTGLGLLLLAFATRRR